MEKGRNRFVSLIINTVLILNLLAVLFLLMSYGAWYIDPRKVWIFAIFGLMCPVLLLVNAGFFIVWMILWKKYALISLAAIILGFNHLATSFSFSFTPREKPLAGDFKAISYNVHMFKGKSWSSGSYRSEIADYISREKPDLICFQEFNIREDKPEPVLRQLSEKWELPYHIVENYSPEKPRIPLSGLAIFSAFPVSGTGRIMDSKGRIFTIFTDLVIGPDTIRLYNVHLNSISFGQRDVDFYNQLVGNRPETIQWQEGVVSVVKKLKKAFINRSEQMTILLAEIAGTNYPVMVCGDFNDTPFSYTYRQVTRNLSDAFFSAENDIFGNTYAGSMPSYRIDYMMYGNGIKACSYYRDKADFSDHYPVCASMILEH
jgi:endonuclease/exonuclease/phosphatase family metal-dependent hydrolase